MWEISKSSPKSAAGNIKKKQTEEHSRKNRFNVTGPSLTGTDPRKWKTEMPPATRIKRKELWS